jgi:hypothetical protein
MDGFVFGAMVGLGFTVIEDIDYFISVFGGSIAGVLEGFWVRVVASGLYGHVLYTGLAGIGVAYFVTRRAEVPFGRRLAVALGLFVLAVVAHFFWNSPWLWELPLFLATALKGMPFFIVLFVALRLARRREHRWLGSALEGEVGRGGAVAEELEVLRDPGRRKAARRAVRVAAGPDAERLLRELHRRQVDLSMLATRAERPDDPDLVRARNEVRALRERLWAAPGVPAALGIQPGTVAALQALPRETPWTRDAVAGPGGVPWWAEPVGDRPPTGTIGPGVELQVVARQGDWAHVRARNGWTGWVDGRRLASPARTFWR